MTAGAEHVHRADAISPVEKRASLGRIVERSTRLHYCELTSIHLESNTCSIASPGVEVGEPVDPRLEDAFDWVSIERELRCGEEERTWGNTAPSGLFALEIDGDTRCEAGLSDAQLIDAMVGFERLAAWAEARQARVLAEFARRRPGDDPTLVATDKPCSMGKFAPDEVGLALKLARMTAKARLGRSVQLEQVLPETLALWQQGRLDERRVSAICDAAHYLTAEKARAVQQRILDRAPDQTVGQLKAALKRAVIQVDPEGAAERYQAARRDRRVSISEEQDGMASLWPLMSAPDAQASFQWLTRLALGCGKDDPRSMDARRSDHVRARDVYCRGPICRRRALDGHLDHIQPYPHGPTNDTNLHGCCGHEHRMKHAPGWAVRALPDGRIQWITPTGHRYHSHPHDYRPDDDLPPDKATARHGLPKDLAARLERIELDRRFTALWDGEAVPTDDEGEPPPF